MTRGSMYAGSSRVIAGLWDADDLVTTELVGNFIKRWSKTRWPPAAALRYAQIRMWKQSRWSDQSSARAAVAAASMADHRENPILAGIMLMTQPERRFWSVERQPEQVFWSCTSPQFF